MLSLPVVLGVVLIALLALAGLRLLDLAYRAFDRRADEREGAGKGKKGPALSHRAGPHA